MAHIQAHWVKFDPNTERQEIGTSRLAKKYMVCSTESHQKCAFFETSNFFLFNRIDEDSGEFSKVEYFKNEFITTKKACDSGECVGSF